MTTVAIGWIAAGGIGILGILILACWVLGLADIFRRPDFDRGKNAGGVLVRPPPAKGGEGPPPPKGPHPPRRGRAGRPGCDQGPKLLTALAACPPVAQQAVHGHGADD